LKTTCAFGIVAKFLVVLSVIFFLLGAALVVLAKQQQVFSLAIAGALSWGVAVALGLFRFLHMKPDNATTRYTVTKKGTLKRLWY
jgi:hypothetical protein